MYDASIHAHHPSWCYCVSCDEWFTSDSAFDRHLGPIPDKGPPMCKHPSEVKKGNERLIYDQAKGAWRWDKEAPVAKLRKYPAAVSPAA